MRGGGGGKIFGGLFWKKVPFLANIERCPKFLEPALTRAFPDNVTPGTDFTDEAVGQCYVPVVKILL